jgi:predicted ferric reductase
VAGGIGITPITSLLIEIFEKHSHGRSRLQRVIVIWSVKDQSQIDWFSSLFQSLPTPEISFEISCYSSLDKPNPKHTSQDLEILAKTDKIQKGNIQIISGRPSFDPIFSSLKKQEKGDVGVFVCGPQGMVDSVSGKCFEFSQGKVKFEFHAETFEL